MSENARNGSTGVAARLSVMMFLEFFIWGAWYVTVSNYMGAHGMSGIIWIAFSLCPIAAIVSPFFLGMIADRFFASEKVLAVMSLLGGVFLLAVPILAKSDSAPLFIPLLALHALCYMPTLGLTNTVAFHHVTNQEKQFPIIRVFGTIGWILANWVVSGMMHGDKSVIQFWVAGAACILLGLFSFALPHTPPPAAGQKAKARDILGLDSLALLKDPSFAVFIICSLLICIPLSFYYAYAAPFVDAMKIPDPAFHMSFGQICEVFFMIIMPILFLRLGVKWMLFTGMVAWVARYGLFAGASTNHVFWMVMLAIILHGMCYDFFFVTGQIYVDKKASAKIRGQAQGFLVLITQGVGMLIGSSVAGYIYSNHSVKDAAGKVLSVDWKALWTAPCIAAAVIAIIFAISFRNNVDHNNTEDEKATAAVSA